MKQKRIVYYRDEQDEVMQFGLTVLHDKIEAHTKEKGSTGMAQGDQVFYRDDQDDMTFFNFIKTKPVDRNFDYERKGVGNWLLRNVFVRCIVIPAFYYLRRIIIRTRFVGRRKLRKHKGGCFIYGNHTEVVPDAARAAIAAFPHMSYIIVHPNNVSIPFLQPLMMALGCIPLPTDAGGMKNFVQAVEKFSEKHPITIFPERVIWPYYTKIRKFSDSSFHYAVKADKPIFTMTTTYHKGKIFRKPFKKVYIDGPFYPDHSLSLRERQKKLCEIAYQTMCERAKLNTYEYYQYVQRDDAPEYREKLAREAEAKKRRKKRGRAAEVASEDARAAEFEALSPEHYTRLAKDAAEANEEPLSEMENNRPAASASEQVPERMQGTPAESVPKQISERVQDEPSENTEE